MATHNYSITFKSLRAGTVYTVNIGGGTGTAIPLKGGAEPFVTEEDATEDMFTPVRTQSGYIRIVDDGKDADGNALGDGWWEDLLPMTDTERPVSLTEVQGVVTIVRWQGYMQSQNFSGTLYGNPQEREFPVHCCVSALKSVTLGGSSSTIVNFGRLIASLFSGVTAYTSFSFQGGIDAKGWLQNLIPMANFMHDVEGAVVPQYSPLDVLEDICRYWGWTMRTRGSGVYFCMMDDYTDWVTFTPAELAVLDSSTAGTAGTSITVILGGDIFASDQNDETLVRGIKSATVKVDVNAESTVVKFAPKDLEDEMGNPWQWVQQQGEDMVGYFKTSTFHYLNGGTLIASAYADAGGFERRIIYTSAESENGISADMIVVNRGYVANTPLIQLETTRAMAYGGGSFRFSGTLYRGAKSMVNESRYAIMHARIGIGMTRASALWFYLSTVHLVPSMPINSGWTQDESNEFMIGINGSSLSGAKVVQQTYMGGRVATFPSIPAASGLFGKLYIDLLGSEATDESSFQIADFTVEYVREGTILPSSGEDVRARTVVPTLKSSRSYSASNSNTVDEKWNADCIFASDNDMEFGTGLIIGTDGDFMATATYGSADEHPEQHLANRVAHFGRKSRKMLGTDLRSNGTNVGSVDPTKKVWLDGVTYYTLAINNNWRDDVTRLTMIEL